MSEERKLDFANNPIFQEILREGLTIQDRFKAEPVEARTGKGYLKSFGVSEIEVAEKRSREGTRRAGGPGLPGILRLAGLTSRLPSAAGMLQWRG